MIWWLQYVLKIGMSPNIKCKYPSLISGLKVGQVTRTIWVTWVTFLEGQVGLICKLTYLDVTWISHVY